MKNPDLDIYTTDGRINPDKAFNLVQETMKTLTADEFRRLATTPVKIRGVDSATVRTTPKSQSTIQPKPRTASKRATAILGHAESGPSVGGGAATPAKSAVKSTPVEAKGTGKSRPTKDSSPSRNKRTKKASS